MTVDLNVMTFNIHHGRGTDGELNLQRIADTIAASQADLVGLNEVDRHFSARSAYVDQIAWLRDYLQMDYAYSGAISRAAGEYGNALLSRYPIQSIRHHRFRFKMAENRSLLEAGVLISGFPISVYVTHLSLDRLTHRRQTAFILDTVKQDAHPAVCLGDWNMRPGSKPWRAVTQHLQDAWQKAGEGCGYTFPSFRPRSRLDYIFLSDDFHVARTEVITACPKASDHLPVSAHVSLADGT